MASVGNILLDKEILLESGTNELELLVFKVAHFTFGINVAKVREILPAASIHKLPKAYPSVRGVFQLREHVIPCVSLIDHLGVALDDEPGDGVAEARVAEGRVADGRVADGRVEEGNVEEGNVAENGGSTGDIQGTESALILTDFNQQQTAFLVDEVERIHRVSWEDILAVPDLPALRKTPVTAVARINEQLVIMLDFEMIIDEVTDQMFRAESFDNPLGLPREELKVLLADDSPSVREAVGTTLRESGYTQLTVFQNGAEAWNWIESTLAETGSVEGVGDLLICDIEMPQIDGFHLTKRIKEHPQLKTLPVLLYSSIATPDNHKKGAAVGADDQITKPELHRVVEIADRLITEAKSRKAGRAVTQTLAEASAVETVASTPALEAETTPPPIAADGPPPQSAPTPRAVKARSPHPQENPPRQSPAPTPSTVERAPERPAEDWTPTGVNPQLWLTFRRELLERATHLSGQIPQVNVAGQADAVRTEIARTLHTIKSAAMVVPVDEVVDTTHVLESVLEAAREGGLQWPQQMLARYAEWLGEIANPFVDPRGVLASAGDLQVTITGELTQLSP